MSSEDKHDMDEVLAHLYQERARLIQMKDDAPARWCDANQGLLDHTFEQIWLCEQALETGHQS